MTIKGCQDPLPLGHPSHRGGEFNNQVAVTLTTYETLWGHKTRDASSSLSL